MNIKSLITSFAILTATSSAAMADSSVSFRGQASIGWSQNTTVPVVRDHRTIPQVRDHRTVVVDDDCTTPAYHQVFQPNNFKLNVYANSTAEEYTGSLASMNARGYGWTSLTEPTRLAAIRMDFWLSGRVGEIHALQLRSTTGSTSVQKVAVEFRDQTVQIVPLNTVLDANHPSATIRVNSNGRLINRIFVYGTASPGGFQILAK